MRINLTLRVVVVIVTAKSGVVIHRGYRIFVKTNRSGELVNLVLPL